MTLMSLAELVKQRREKADLTQDELAERSGIGRTTISAIEQGRIKIPQPAILKALVLKLPLTMKEAVAAMGYEDPRGEPDAAFFAEADEMSADLEKLAERWRQRIWRQSSTGRQAAE